MASLSLSIPGLPPILNQIPNINLVPSMLTIPNVTNLLNQPSVAAIQALPNVLSIIKAPSINAIATLPGISGLIGVPNLSALVRVPSITDILNLVDGGGLAQEDADDTLAAFDDQVWGIYLNGELALEPDSIFTFGFDNSWRVTNAPQEKGAFQSYNKVSTPYDSRVMVTLGGSDQDRAAFLQTIDDLANSLDLYDIVTPDRIYTSANIYDYNLIRRAENGVGLLSVELKFTEIRVPAQQNGATTQAVTSVATPSQGVPVSPQESSGASPISLGSLQGLIPSPSQILAFGTSALKNKATGLATGLVSNITGGLVH